MTWSRALTGRFRPGGFARDAAVLTMGSALAQLLTIAAMPVLSRLYSPKDFGVLAVFMAVSSIVATGATLRYETSILLPKEEGEATFLALLSIVLATLLGLTCGAVAWLLPEKIQSALGVSSVGAWLPLAVLTGMATAVIAIGTAWLNRQRAYSKIAALRITQSVLGAGLGIGLGLYGYVAGLLAAQFISLLTVAVIAVSVFPALLVRWDKHALRGVALLHIAAPKYLLPTALLDVISLQLPVLLITAWFGSETAGQFSMAWKILVLPMALVGVAVGQVFLQRFSQAWPDKLSARRLLFGTWKALMLVGILPAILVMLLGEQLFVWALGDAWSEAGRIAAVIAPMLLVMLVSSPTSGIFLVLGLQKYSLYFGAAFIVYRSGCIYLGVADNSLIYGLAAWVICEVAAIASYNLIALKRMKTW